MRRLLAMSFGVLVGGGIVFAAFQYHVVRTTDKFLFVARRQAAWRDAYVDIRTWTPREWTEHSELAKDLIAAGQGSLVVRPSPEWFFQDLFGGLRDKSPFNRGTPRPAARE